MSLESAKSSISNGKAVMGIELGSTRIKAVLIDEYNEPIASGGFDWENSLIDGVWTYSLEDVWKGIQSSYQKVAADVVTKYNVQLTSLAGFGISAMMHGYLVFDSQDKQLAQFRTWRNTFTDQASGILTEKFQFSIPQRWSIAHLYQAILNGEDHVSDINYITTLAGYVHWKLTGKKVVGIGEASGMFPIDSTKMQFNEQMLNEFETLISDKKTGWKLSNILPQISMAGENAGSLTAEGARLLDPTGSLQAGIPMCPPEGDAGTGMVATNSIGVRTGNISAGTSIFAMIVLEKALSELHTEIDMVTTPAGMPVAMVHSNNCTGDLDAWVKLFGEVLDAAGAKMDKPALYDMLYYKALLGDTDCGGLLSYNYLSGEHLTGLEEGRPMFVRNPESKLSLNNFMRTLLYSSMSTLKLGMNILMDQEKVQVEKLLGHGGLFKTKGVGQRFMAAALNTPVSVMESAGEGGAWGIALLAGFMVYKQQNETLDAFLNNKVFQSMVVSTETPKPDDVEGFSQYIQRYETGLEIERTAVSVLK